MVHFGKSNLGILEILFEAPPFDKVSLKSVPVDPTKTKPLFPGSLTRSWVRKVRLGNSQFVIAEILNYICICSHLVQAFGRHGAIDTNGTSTRMVVCGTKAYRTKKSRGILAKRGKKSATPQHMAQQPQQLELRALLQRRARENGG